MGRVLTKGSVQFADGYWRAFISFPKGPSRPQRERYWFRLTASTEALARVQALKLAELARTGRLSPPDRARKPTPPAPKPGDTIPDRDSAGRETVKGWTRRWLVERERRGLKSTRSDEARLRAWVWPRLGALPIAEVTRAQIEEWVEAIDADVREDELAWKTALNAWGLISKLFTDASCGKPRDLRVREDDPTERVMPPDRGARKGKQFLYPSEMQRLLECDAVEVAVRQVYALAVFLYPREGELEALHCEDIDLVHGTVHFHRARHADTGEIRETKGNRPRRVHVHRHVQPLLRLLVERAGGHGPLWPTWPCWKDRSGQLRKGLARAGVSRAELFDGGSTQKAMTFHDLRATGITWEAIVGTDLTKIQQRAGHSTTNTTLIYVRLADEVRGVGFGTPFGPLPQELLPGDGYRISYTGTGGPTQKPFRAAAKQQFGERDSNPHSGYQKPASCH